MRQEDLGVATVFAPSSAPHGVGSPAGTYTTIVKITAPDSAPAGTQVNVTIMIKNTWTADVHVAAIGVWDSEKRFIDWLEAWISPGTTQSFSGSFIMPARDVTIHAYSYYEATGGRWYLDDERTKDVNLAAVWQKLATKAVTLTPVVVAWQKLATKSVTLTPIAVAWQKLATKTVTITPLVAPWQKLAAQAITLTPVEVPPTMELLEQTIYPYAYIYEGPCTKGTFTFKTDPFTPANWIAGVLAGHVEDEVRKAGGRIMEMKVYVDKTPLLWTDWRIEVITVPPKTTGTAMPLGMAWWAAALLIALTIVLIIVITWAAKEVAGLFKRNPALKDVKVGWTKDTLIRTIQDSEEYWERTPTPVETLQGMSDEELREYLDKIAEEEVPPVEGIGLAIAAAGVLGLGVLALGAMAMARPEETRK